MRVAPLPGERSEVAQRLHFLSPLEPGPMLPRMSFRAPRALPAPVGRRPFAVVNPGGRLGWRRIPPSVFAAAARELERRGIHALVTWGPGEEALADEVVSQAPGATRAPPSDLDQLAGWMRGAQLTVCNNTGPMHLSVAVGTPTLALFLRIEVARWGHPHPPHRMVDLTAAADSPRELERTVERELGALVDGLAAAVRRPSPSEG